MPEDYVFAGVDESCARHPCKHREVTKWTCKFKSMSTIRSTTPTAMGDSNPHD